MQGAAAAWRALDPAWQEALRQAWEAVATGNIGVGAVVTDPAGRILRASRNRVADREAPPGEVCGSSVAHAEVNALATLPFRHPRELVLTTTLQPCLQCAAVIRMSPIALLRIGGADPLWDGCGDFSGLSPWVARRPPLPVEGPLRDEVGVFATLVARLGPGLVEAVDVGLRDRGEGPLLDLVAALQGGHTVDGLLGLTVDEAMDRLWDDLTAVRAALLGS